MQTTTSALAHTSGGLLAKGFTAVEEVAVGDLWHPTRDLAARRIVAIRNTSGGRRLTDEHGCSRTYKNGTEVPTAVLIGGASA